MIEDLKLPPKDKPTEANYRMGTDLSKVGRDKIRFSIMVCTGAQIVLTVSNVMGDNAHNQKKLRKRLDLWAEYYGLDSYQIDNEVGNIEVIKL